MKFRYEFDIDKCAVPITHQSKLLLVGSCFTENMAQKLQACKIETLYNPNGILFNPVSVAEALINVIENKQYTTEDLFEYNEAWHSWQHHSQFSSPNAAEAVKGINQSTQQAHEYIKKATHLFITLGSAWVYSLTDEALNATVGTIAANNHKAPHSWFQKKLMLPSQVVMVLGTMLNKLGNINPNIHVSFTISPVRHLREGAINNNRSKAVLIQAIHELVERLPKLHYFPAYELVVDDLRDYRFYAEDLAHPNYAATDYVWEKFIASYFDEATLKLLPQIKDINTAFNHKPFNTQSQQHKKFLASYQQKIQHLTAQYPYLNFDKEVAYFSQQNN